MRILLVAHDFPPLNSSAARRPYSWATAWSARGHDVQVVTTAKYCFDGRPGFDLPQVGYTLTEVAYLPARYALAAGAPDNGGQMPSRTFELLRRATRRMRLGLGLMTQTPMLASGALLRACLDKHSHTPFDLIVSTSGPEVCTFVAHAFAKRTGIPWIADYRDLWFQEFAIQRFAFTTWLTGVLNKRMIRRAAAIVTVSEGLAGYLREFARCPVWVCYNGFLEKPQVSAEPIWKDGRVHLVYTGNFYPEKRDPRSFFAAMAALFEDHPELRDTLRLDIYGPSEGWVRAQVRELGLDEIVVEHGIVTYAESLRAQTCSDALLFVDWMDPNAKGVLTGKLFEYLASARPILNICRDESSEASRLIRDAGAGEPLSDSLAIRRALEALAQRSVNVPVDEIGIARFSRRAQADALLDRIVELVSGEKSRMENCIPSIAAG